MTARTDDTAMTAPDSGDRFGVRRLWHTVRFLRARQVYGRLWFRAYRPKPDLRSPPPARTRTGPWQEPAPREPSLLGPDQLRLLEETRQIAAPDDWDRSDVPKLWRYNLHYFDDLNARYAAARTTWHARLIERWIDENPPGRGTGWEPYPVSLRVVNWIKWANAGNALSPAARTSLAVQARWLAHRLETHLLGNHLLANAKALTFAGLFFAGEEARGWLDTGLAILGQQLPEQVLADGGHFERSPMYHSIALEDVLDLCNAAVAWPGRIEPDQIEAWRVTARRMLHWLVCMCHPDGEIALFNDSAFGVAAAPSELSAYAARLGLNAAPADALEHLTASGYVRVERGPLLIFADVGDIGPDYLPGHAHADTLSFELSLAGQRWIVDSGCSTYAVGPERLRQRGTAAHNTVVVAGRDSSEVWSSFRVARRAKARDVSVTSASEDVLVQGAHDGYLHGSGPLHRRRWTVSPSSVLIEDELDGPFTSATAYLHLHPEVAARATSPTEVELTRGGRRAVVRAWGADLGFEASTWHPRFNCSVPSQAVVARFCASTASLALEVG